MVLFVVVNDPRTVSHDSLIFLQSLIEKNRMMIFLGYFEVISS